MKKTVSKRAEFALAFGLIASILLSVSRFSANCDELRSNVLRLHILANSDSQADQAVKLAVRDRLLKASQLWLTDCDDLSTVTAALQTELDAIEAVADAVLSENGFSYRATATVGPGDFETREYPDFTLPAGTYQALTVTLGEGKGHNWWCVIFPAVCLPTGEKSSLSETVGKQSVAVAENPKPYRIRFKTVEWYEAVKRYWKSDADKKKKS